MVMLDSSKAFGKMFMIRQQGKGYRGGVNSKEERQEEKGQLIRKRAIDEKGKMK